MLADPGRPGTGLGERLDLGMGEMALFLTDGAWEVDAGRDIASQASVFDGHVEDERQHAMDLAHGRWRAFLRQFGDPSLHVGVRDLGELRAIINQMREVAAKATELTMNEATNQRAKV